MVCTTSVIVLVYRETNFFGVFCLIKSKSPSALSIVLPSASWPLAENPHPKTFPSSSKARLCASPAAICTTFLPTGKPFTFFGSKQKISVLSLLKLLEITRWSSSPSYPPSPRPKTQTSPASVSIIEWSPPQTMSIMLCWFGCTSEWSLWFDCWRPRHSSLNLEFVRVLSYVGSEKQFSFPCPRSPPWP